MFFDELVEDDEVDANATHALGLLAAQFTELLSAVAPEKDAPKPNEREYRRRRRQLDAILDNLGIAAPFTWPTVAQAVAFAKTMQPTYAGRRQYLRELYEPVAQQLQRRIDDQVVGDPQATITGLGRQAELALQDPAAIRVELARIEAAMHQDPSVAVGKAKNLIEATAKAVLVATNRQWDANQQVPGLARAAMEALGVDRRTTEGHDQDAAVLMGQLHALTNGVAAMRNKIGDGHGAEQVAVGVDLRHGRLAVRAAVAWCSFMLETLHDRPIER
ncbi:abortive infection family protein [Micromonospora cathayae]|uniref:Abortive infection family protein n=1 Tax=Micromonospora cathayae TaxID=3028804 RepID=A0ABY7ZM04_9ACTN|nr:abortive infection family protein [Micromonospora sp. HUAS 3]WDZ84035.1 abortive infection family protein [Micromonospora sp. HUAS 3]